MINKSLNALDPLIHSNYFIYIDSFIRLYVLSSQNRSPTISFLRTAFGTLSNVITLKICVKYYQHF